VAALHFRNAENYITGEDAMLRPVILFILLCPIAVGCREKQPPKLDEGAEFPLKEVSLSQALKSCPELGYCGQRVILGLNNTDFREDSTVPKKEVKKYPSLLGPKPLYGSIKLNEDFLKPGGGIEYQFVVDASVDAGYDTLYFDANHDLDLTNDPPATLNRGGWPAGLRSPYEIKNRLLYRIFNEINVPMDFGPDYGVRPVQLLPFMSKFSNDTDMHEAVAIFFLNLSFHAGEIQIGDKHLQAVLAQSDPITGRFDRPGAKLYLMIPGKTDLYEYWNSSDDLRAYRFVNGKYYTTSTTPVGDKLFVQPYTGDIGAIKIRPGGRDIEEMTIAGSIYSTEHAVALGPIKDVNPEPVSKWQAPVGDYLLDYSRIDYGPLHMNISENYHTDGKRQNWNRQRKYTIQIRKEKPFELDFSNKPEIMFASPAKDSIFRPGDDVQVYAVLIDPALDIMIRGLNDTRQKIKDEIDVGEGNKETREKSKALDPAVTIADSSGKTVAEGTMPFG
jgi:hypothetical protein